jgi:hypothetical protein
MKLSKILKMIGSGAVGWMLGYTVSSWAFNSNPSFNNHRAIAGTTGLVGIVGYAVLRELGDRDIDQLAIAEAIAHQLAIRQSDEALTISQKEALENAAVIFAGDAQYLKRQSRIHSSTLNQLFER